MIRHLSVVALLAGVSMAVLVLSASSVSAGSNENAIYAASIAGDQLKLQWSKEARDRSCGSSEDSPWVLRVTTAMGTTLLPCLPTSGGESAPSVDTAFGADLDRDGVTDAVVVYSVPGYFAEYSASGRQLFIVCLSRTESGWSVLPFFSEYLGGARVAQSQNGAQCDDPYCSVRAIAAEINVLASVTIDSVLGTVHAFAAKSFRSKLVKQAGQVSRISLAIISHLTVVNAFLYNDLGYFLEQAGFYEEAAKVLSEVVGTVPDRTVAYLNLADACAGTGDKGKAKENYRKYVALMEKAGRRAKIPERVRKAVAD